MLNIPDSVKSLFKQDGVRKNFRVHFPNGELSDLTNENVVQESVRFTESICSQDVFKFGLTEASVIEYETVGVANMYGMTIECACEIDCTSLTAAEVEAIEAGTWDGEYIAAASSDLGYAFFRVPYGTFRVESCPRDHQAMTHRRVKAFSPSVSDGTEFPGLPLSIPWPSIAVDASAIVSEIFEDNLTVKQSEVMHGVYFDSISAYFWDAEGGLIHLYLQMHGIQGYEGREPLIEKLIYGRSYTAPYSYPDKSFVKAESNFDAIKNRAFGEALVAAVTEAGYDLTYDSRGNKKYANNLEAVESEIPIVFAPVLRYTLNNGSWWYEFYQEMAPNKLCPVLMPFSAQYDQSFSFKPTRQADCSAVWFQQLGLPQNKAPEDYRLEVYRDSGNDYTREYVYFNAPYELPHSITITTFSQTTPAPSLVLEPTDAFTKKYIPLSSGETSELTIRQYSYANTYQVLEQLNGALELQARFSTSEREGGNKLLRISSASPVAIAPGDYSQMWFDEYNVEPIGTVRYAYTDDAGEKQIVDYKFGDGASVYDMTDNAVLEALDGAGPDVIEALLDASFIPYISSVNFVPVDLAMKGLPYLEAGDAISVTAQDGTVCSSYALRQEIDGIQSLEAQIDSQSGLIIESEAGA